VLQNPQEQLLVLSGDALDTEVLGAPPTRLAQAIGELLIGENPE
jgi:hypothetical protein